MSIPKILVVDAGPIITGARLHHLAEEFYTVDEVLAEVRDKKARHILETLPFEIKTRQVSPEDLAFGWNHVLL